MAVEVHARAARIAVATRNDIDARVALTVPRRAGSMHILDRKTTRAQAAADEFRAGLIRLTGWIDGGKTNQRLHQLDQVVATLIDRLEQRLLWIGAHVSLRVCRARVNAARLRA
jgi:hypothetical protein